MSDRIERMIADIPPAKGQPETVSDIASEYSLFSCIEPVSSERVKSLVLGLVRRFTEANRRETEYVRKFVEDIASRDRKELLDCLKEATDFACKKCCHFSIDERKCYDGIECPKHDCTPRKWREVLERHQEVSAK